MGIQAYPFDPVSSNQSRTMLTHSTSPQPSARRHPVLLIEFNSWEEKQQAELTRLHASIALLLREHGDLRKKYGAVEVELRDAHRLIQKLEQENDNSQKKSDSADVCANSWERAYEDLKTKLETIETQNEKLVREKHQAIAEVLREKSRNIDKDKEVGNLGRELKGLASSYQNLHKRHEQAIDKAKEPRVVMCTQCYTKKWPCDAGHPCQACIARGIPGGCKRVKCQFWAKGTCPKLQCGLAHEDDGFSVVIEHRKLKQKLTAMPEEVRKSLTAPASRRTSLVRDTQQVHTTPYDVMDQTLDFPSSNNRANMQFQTFTARAGLSHRSLEEYRLTDYTKGGRRYTQYSDPHNQHSSFQWDREFPGGPLRAAEEHKKVDTGLPEALTQTASLTAASSLSPTNVASKKRGRDDVNAKEGDESTKREKLNMTVSNPNDGDVSIPAFGSDKTSIPQAHIVQESQDSDPMDQESDPEDNAGLSLDIFTMNTSRSRSTV
ncbi:hypothetical protein PMIN06_002270 [Paraphaeosphaeria minitans]